MESSRMTTSFLCSTSRFAFSITISATCTWRLAGSSKVEATTSPRTERDISVTSSGRSSISSTMSEISGWLETSACAMCCSITVLPAFGDVAVDLVDLDQREVALAVLRRADLALDRVAGVQVEAADLRRRDVDVVGARQVRGLGRAQEAEAVGQHFERAVAEDRLALLRRVLQHGEDQVLLAHPVGTFDAVCHGHLDQLGDVVLF